MIRNGPSAADPISHITDRTVTGGTTGASRTVSPERLSDHRQWVDSDGGLGRRLVLVVDEDEIKATEGHPRFAHLRNYRGVNLSGADLSRADLSGADLRGCDLTRANLHGADLTGAVLWDADLSSANLRDVRGLRPNKYGDAHPLGGADLSGADVAGDGARFEILESVNELTEKAGKVFLTTVLVDLFLLLMAARTTDWAIVVNGGRVQIPIVDAAVSVQGLFWLGPAILLALYFAFQIHLQRIWEMAAGLPAVFPDGLPVTLKTHKWLLRDMIYAGFPRLGQRAQLFTRTQTLYCSFVAYMLIPLSMLPLWARYLVKHDWAMTSWHIGLTAVFAAIPFVFFRLGRATMMRSEQTLSWYRASWSSSARPNKLRLSLTPLVAAAAIILVGWLISHYAIDTGLPASFYSPAANDWQAQHREDVGIYNPSRWAPRVLSELGYSPFANLRGPGAAVSQPTPSSAGGAQTADLTAGPAGVDLASANLRAADLRGAFLAGADLSGANLKEADMTDANLTGAHTTERTLLENSLFAGANLAGIALPGASLTNVDFRNANLEGVDFEGADMSNSRFSGASMSGADLRGAFMQDADMDQADLSNAQLAHARLLETVLLNANLRGADLTGARLSGGYLYFADLSGANLSAANLSSADLTGVKLTNAQWDASTIWPPGFDPLKHGEMKERPPDDSQAAAKAGPSPAGLPLAITSEKPISKLNDRELRAALGIKSPAGPAGPAAVPGR